MLFSRAVAVIFLLTSVIIVITLAHFLVGLVVRRAVCDPLKNPGDDQLFGYVDKFINLNEYLNPTNFNRNSRIGRNRELVNADNTPLTISQVIESCHANETIYKVSWKMQLFFRKSSNVMLFT
jgi:prominin 1